MAAATSSQLNVRMDSELRSAGDAVLERVGISPAEVVRALWAKIAGGVQHCEQVLSLLAEQPQLAEPSRGEACLATIDRWQSELFALATNDRASYVAPTDEELDEMLYDEWLACDAEQVRL